MKIEAGKYYRTRDGRKVGPVEFSEYGRPWATAPGFDKTHWYTQWSAKSDFAGRASIYCEHPDDLIAEWTDEPAEPKPSPFVTRRELVPGVYGKISVIKDDMDEIHIECNEWLTADELDEAAHLFAQLAEYLRETKP